MKPEDPADNPPTQPYPDRDEASPNTLPQTPAAAAYSGQLAVDDPTATSGTYALGEVIGRGGMGEVLVAHDRRIGRDVALKRLRSGTPTEDEVGRFLREARIQARLDHPAIVPVYEMARDAAGRPYFTMKRLAGSTLSDILARGATGLHHRLLRAFADVCRAIDFAHSRGVIHRDLKPANIVLGEFGEVYVLDWGVARVLDDVEGVVAADIETLEGTAPEGHVLGTPGYMPPEQLSNADVERSADVYALGSILFELLAAEPLHPRGTAAMASTLSGDTVTSPATRRPDRGIAPELDALCTAMLANRTSHRPTARRCADRIEQYLDGDRDVTHRRALATELVWNARAALDSDLRAEAMRMASRALALDPTAAGAAEIVTTLMLEPPRELPDDLKAALRQCDHDDVSRHAKEAMPGYVMIAGFLPIVLWTGVLRWSVVALTIVVALAMAAAANELRKRPERALSWMVVYAIGNGLVILTLGRIAGPLGFVPALLSFITASVITYPVFLERPVLLVAIMLGAFVAPLGLEAAGVLSETWTVLGGGILLHSNAIELSGTSAVITLALASGATVVMAGRQSSVLGRAKRQAQHQLVIQAWHLRQLLPAPAGPVPGASPRAGSVAGFAGGL